MGLFTPKYPKSDTPGAAPAPAPHGMTDSQIRSLARQSGVTVDIRDNTAKVTVDEWDTDARITSQVYVKQSDGSWAAG
jgi:hypothetical protein